MSVNMERSRPPRPTLQQLEDKFNDVVMKQNKYMSIDPLSLDEGAQVVLLLELKQLGNTLYKIGSDYVALLLKNGCLEEANKARLERRRYINEVNEVITILNGCTDRNISNIAQSSNASFASVHSEPAFEVDRTRTSTPVDDEPLASSKLETFGSSSVHRNMSEAKCTFSCNSSEYLKVKENVTDGICYMSDGTQIADRPEKKNLVNRNEPIASIVNNEQFRLSNNTLQNSSKFGSFERVVKPITLSPILESENLDCQSHGSESNAKIISARQVFPKVIPLTEAAVSSHTMQNANTDLGNSKPTAEHLVPSSLSKQQDISSLQQISSRAKDELTHSRETNYVPGFQYDAPKRPVPQHSFSSNAFHYDSTQGPSSYGVPSSHFQPIPIQEKRNAHFSRHNNPNVPFPQGSFAANFQPNSYSNPVSACNPNDFTAASLAIMSKHLTQQDMLKSTIKKFSGEPSDYWPWVGKISSYLETVNLTPLQAAQFIENNASGGPQRMISDYLASLATVTGEDIRELWDSLTYAYGSSTAISRDLMTKLKGFPPIGTGNRGEQLSKLVGLCRVILYNQQHCRELFVLDLATGLRDIRAKLPEYMQRKWASFGQSYEDAHPGCHPPFSEFVKFLKEQSRVQNNSNYEIITEKTAKTQRVMQTDVQISNTSLQKESQAKEEPGPSYVLKTYQAPHTSKTSVSIPNKKPPISDTTNDGFCSFHKKPGHSLQQCQAFRKQQYDARKKFAYESGLCFKCLNKHRAADCRLSPKCEICHRQHTTGMHRDFTQANPGFKKGEQRDPRRGRESSPEISVNCLKVCGRQNMTRQCSKTLLVEISMPNISDRKLRAYAIIDDQATTTLVDEKVISFFDLKGLQSVEYTTNFASQGMSLSWNGHKVKGLKVRGILEEHPISVQDALSFPDLADTRNQVATPAIVRLHKHTAPYANCFPEFDSGAEVLLLLGTDCDPAMAGNNLSTQAPYLHKTPIGYALVGKVCSKGSSDIPRHILRTAVQYESPVIAYNFTAKAPLTDTFDLRSDDDEQGLSTDDRTFLDIMRVGVTLNKTNHLELPLPIKQAKLPNNKLPVFQRTQGTLNKIKSNSDKRAAVVEIMSKNLDRGYVEQVPQGGNPLPGEAWYLPIFCVEHKKKLRPRLVYDASAKFKGVCLNDALYQGPDLNNTLRGVLLRFREWPVAFSSDIMDMFCNFQVPEHHRDYLRFFWWKNNDPQNSLVPFRGTSHMFGLTSSPAVASFGLKYCASTLNTKEDAGTRSYLEQSFYVDDGLLSCQSANEAIEILQKSVQVLRSFNIRLHKIASNDPTVLQAFPDSERAVPISPLPSNVECQRALGVVWHTSTDSLIVKAEIPIKPFTKRGILSVINSLYDPAGLISPVILAGRLIQREILPSKDQNPHPHFQHLDWDDDLPQHYRADWEAWIQSICQIDGIEVPRALLPYNFAAMKRELHIFCDASFNAIGFVIYLRSLADDQNVHVSYVTGSSKVAPRTAHSIPRLELCAAVDAAKAASVVKGDLSVPPDSVHFYTDSQITFAYICNTQKRFSKYIERRVAIILTHSKTTEWKYVTTEENPADIATRPHTPKELETSSWFTGPRFLHLFPSTPDYNQNEAIIDGELPEEKQEVATFFTTIDPQHCFFRLMTRISNFSKLLGVIKLILGLRSWLDRTRQGLGMLIVPRNPFCSRDDALIELVRHEQHSYFPAEVRSLKKGESLSDSSLILDLAPYLDQNQVIRVGGRLANANIPFSVKHPLLIPEKSPIAKVIVEHFHSQVKHQGSHISHGSILQAGFFIQNGRRLIRNVVNQCVTCRRLRSPPVQQQMAILPVDRLEETPPFTNVGLDVFGPFFIHDGIITRRTSATKKVWALIIVCLPSRAIHLEPLPAMDTSSFRNALSRFMAVRGQCTVIRSDQGSNFICARKQFVNVDIQTVMTDSKFQNLKWTLNPPHASHFGGSWERKIGSVRRVLEGALEQASRRPLSRDEFNTLLAEAAAIVNNTPLWTVPNSPNDPSPLSPAMLLTLRDGTSASDPTPYSENDLLQYGQRRYRRVQYLADQFWTRWRKEYLMELTRRRKWKQVKPILKQGDVVILRDRSLPRNSWPLGRITEVSKSTDGLVRSATVSLPPLRKGQPCRTFHRAIADIVLLISPADQ